MSDVPGRVNDPGEAGGLGRASGPAAHHEERSGDPAKEPAPAVQRLQVSLIPSPEEMAAYSRTISQGAERIMTMAEAQQTHRHVLEKQLVTEHFRQVRRGQFFGLITLVSLVTVFVTGQQGGPEGGE